MVSRVGPYTAMAAAPGTQYSGLANLMAMQGTGGDNTLVHMSKAELPYLNTLARAAGHTNGLPINPKTGLPEANILKSILPIAGGIIGSMVLPGIGGPLFAGAIGSGLGAGLGTFGGNLLAGKSLKDAAIGGLMSGGLAGLGAATFGGQSLFGDTIAANPATTGAIAPETFVEGVQGLGANAPVGANIDPRTGNLFSSISDGSFDAVNLGEKFTPVEQPSWMQPPRLTTTPEFSVAPGIPAGRVSVEGLQNPANLSFKKGVTDISKTAADRLAGLPEKAGWLDMGTVYGGIPEGVPIGEYLKYALNP
jgi:hypothetical protein